MHLTNTLALAYFAVIRQRTSSGLLQQGKYRGRQICENMLNLLTAVISPCKSRPPQQAAKLLLKTTPEAHCPLSSGQRKEKKKKKRERGERIPQKSAETGWLQKVKNSPPTSKCLGRIPDTHLALCGSLRQVSDFLFPPQVLPCKLNVWRKKKKIQVCISTEGGWNLRDGSSHRWPRLPFNFQQISPPSASLEVNQLISSYLT